jgi:hypothetical protein
MSRPVGRSRLATVPGRSPGRPGRTPPGRADDGNVMSSGPAFRPMPGSLPPGAFCRNAAVAPPASKPLESPEPGLAGRVDGNLPLNAPPPPVAGKLTKSGIVRVGGVRPAAGSVPALGRNCALGRRPLCNEAMPALLGRRLTPEPERIPGVGRLPYADRATGVRLANPPPPGRLNDDGRELGRDMEGVRPVAPPKLERGARKLGPPP